MPIDRVFVWYRTTLCAATALMVLMSWPLWIDQPDFPRVPFFLNFLAVPRWVSWFLLVGFVSVLFLGSLGVAWRSMVGVGLILLTIMVVQDQNRFQPWVYQYLVIGVGLVGVSRARALVLARWYTIGLYAYSGLSKVDASFCLELGPTFLSAGFGIFGVSTADWPTPVQTAASLTMPAFELLVAGLLGFEKTRRLGLVGSLLLHACLVVILGPWSLGHSTIVLVWNVAQGIENIIIFGPIKPFVDSGGEPKFWFLAAIPLGIALVLPIGERWGLADAWPAHALYASHAERSDIFIHEQDLDHFPESIRRNLGPAGMTHWRRLDLTGWSRASRGTPLYPSGRVGNAVAEFLETRYRPVNPIRLIQWNRASLGSASRESDEILGLNAIRRRGDRFVLNAHPAP